MTAIMNASTPNTRPQDLDQDEPLYEIIDGERVELPPMSILSNQVASLLHGELSHHLKAHPTGRGFMEALFRLPLPIDRNRRPDVAYASNERIAQASSQSGSENAWAIVPELMVEVVSPSDLAEEIMEKLTEYFAAGATLVWVIYPTRRFVYVYEGLKQVRILDQDDELDGGRVLTNFKIPIGNLFPDFPTG
ncbi:MAG: Uma2 family endonuclease [Gemmataceae bacterium]